MAIDSWFTIAEWVCNLHPVIRETIAPWVYGWYIGQVAMGGFTESNTTGEHHLAMGLNIILSPKCAKHNNTISKTQSITSKKGGRTRGMQREHTKDKSDVKKDGFSVSNQAQGLTCFLCRICLHTIKGGHCDIQRWPSSPWCYHIVSTSPRSFQNGT